MVPNIAGHVDSTAAGLEYRRPDPRDPVQVLYVGGAGRSGSTILCRVLGSQPNFVTVGEVCLIWQFGVIEDRRCSCGSLFSSCAFWQSVAQAAPGIFDDKAAAENAAYFRSVLQLSRRMPSLWTRRGRHGLLSEIPTAFLSDLSRLYRAIAEVTGASVVIDGSKLATYEYLLRMVPEVDVTTIRLVRDTRAVAYSWLREQKRVGEHGASEPQYMAQRRTLVSGLDWIVQNLSTEKVGSLAGDQVRQLRYEDFVASPANTTREIVNMMGLTFSSDNPNADGEVVFAEEHVFGNPNRFETGRIAIRSDDQWQRCLSPVSRFIVTSCTAPFLVSYGYPLRLRGDRH